MGLAAGQRLNYQILASRQDSAAGDTRIVHEVSDMVEPGDLLQRLQQLFSPPEALPLPSQIEWDDTDGTPVSGGRYVLIVQVTGSAGQTVESSTVEIVVDYTATEATVSETNRVLSPNDDGVKDRLVPSQSGSEETLWRGILRTSGISRFCTPPDRR